MSKGGKNNKSKTARTRIDREYSRDIMKGKAYTRYIW